MTQINVTKKITKKNTIKKKFENKSSLDCFFSDGIKKNVRVKALKPRPISPRVKLPRRAGHRAYLRGDTRGRRRVGKVLNSPHPPSPAWYRPEGMDLRV